MCYQCEWRECMTNSNHIAATECPSNIHTATFDITSVTWFADHAFDFVSWWSICSIVIDATIREIRCQRRCDVWVCDSRSEMLNCALFIRNVETMDWINFFITFIFSLRTKWLCRKYLHPYAHTHPWFWHFTQTPARISWCDSKFAHEKQSSYNRSHILYNICSCTPIKCRNMCVSSFYRTRFLSFHMLNAIDYLYERRKNCEW